MSEVGGAEARDMLVLSAFGKGELNKIVVDVVFCW